jgi:uncharacterized protein (DUF1501 family)
MKRRNFIKLTSTASAISLLPSQVTASLNIAKSFLDCTISNRKLVLINLAGGNDGLNTIIPINYYDIYSNLRPSIKVPSNGLNSYINLDDTLDETQQIGLHPSLTGFKNLYDNDLLRIVQSVGYPSQNKSHLHQLIYIQLQMMEIAGIMVTTQVGLVDLWNLIMQI